MNYWEIIADNLHETGWSYGYVSALDSKTRRVLTGLSALLSTQTRQKPKQDTYETNVEL